MFFYKSLLKGAQISTLKVKIYNVIIWHDEEYKARTRIRLITQQKRHLQKFLLKKEKKKEQEKNAFAPIKRRLERLDNYPPS